MWHRAVFIAVVAALTPALLVESAWGQKAAPVNRADVLALSQRIDTYLARRWHEANLTPAPRAEDAVFFRRLNLDLAGKIPTLLDVRDFMQNPDPDKSWLWTEQLLEAESYPRHMASVWRSLILGSTQNQQARFLAPSFEAWLRGQFQKNVTLDTMTRALLTTPVNGANPLAAVRGMQQTASPVAFFIANENKAENLATATSRAFLGIKLDCAQCHAHPFASWTREQFWEFAAFFTAQQGMRLPGLPAVTTGNGREIQIPNTDKVVKARFLTGQEPKWETGSDSRKVVTDWITGRENPYFARAMADHVWTYLMGASLLAPIQEPGEGQVTHPELLDVLAQQLAAHDFDVKFLLRAIIHSEAYRCSSAGSGNPEDLQFFARRLVRGLAPEQMYDSITEATDSYRANEASTGNPALADFGPMGRTPRAEFLNKFQSQDPREEPQTSILQALYLMNGKFISDRTRVDQNGALRVLATQPTSTARKIETMYLMVLSRPPRTEEMERLVRYVDGGVTTEGQAQALSDVYWALLNNAELLLNH